MSSTILVIEHEPSPRSNDSLKQDLRQEGYRVVTIGTADVFEMLEVVSPDLVVLDVHVAEPWATVSRLVERRPRIPILVVAESWSDADGPTRASADAFATTTTSDTRPARTKVRQLLDANAF